MPELSKLKWQCRRGIKELDIVLTNYLEQYYPDANKNEQTAFKQLLELEDPVLFELLLENDNGDLLKLTRFWPKHYRNDSA